MENQLLLVRLEKVLGKSTKTAGTNYAFYCPFCNHRKKKLEIDLQTDNKGKNRWACWVCSSKGQTIYSLLKQLRASHSTKKNILSLISTRYVPENNEYTQELTLPESFTPLGTKSKDNFLAGRYRKYLYSRGITEPEIISYNIGYCTKGEYEGRIIIPSYSSENKLNFIIGRAIDKKTFPKYKNPSGNKDLIFFENRINWNLPIVLVEGVFDAMAVKQNAIPLLGTSPSPYLLRKLIENNVQKVYIALDGDAIEKALSLSMKVQQLVSEVYLITLPETDPSDIGFKNIHKIINNTEPLTDTQALKYKLTI